MTSLLLVPLASCRPDVPVASGFLGEDGSGTTSVGSGGETSTGMGDDTVAGSGGGSGTGDSGTGSMCGDGIVDEGEDCDDAGESAACNDDCTWATCGDGLVNEMAQEECDQGGQTEGCDVDCTLAFCGDGTFNEMAGEECDTMGRTGRCDMDCTLVDCGDGRVNAAAGEQCDDMGESVGCNSDCTVSQCGDGVTNATAGEDCDTMGESMTCDDDCTVVECGDSNINEIVGEVCDDAELGGETCESQGFGGGTLGCDGACQLDTSGCYECGDGVANPGEECDMADLGGNTCVSLGFDGGTLGCDGTCLLDTSGCYECGDGAIDPGEECDDGGESPTCDSDCTVVACGDGLINASAGEICDDGGPSALCDGDCTPVECGDALINPLAAEECEGADLAGATCQSEGFDGGTLSCDAMCHYDTNSCYGCGDGAIDPGEQCDGVELGGIDCGDLGFIGGTLGCTGICSYDTSNCYGCNDGVFNGDETDLDCGGSCGMTCEPGEDCLIGGDCISVGCDPGSLTCNDYISVAITSGCEEYAGAPVPLLAAASGGTGGPYTYAWTPDDGTLSAPNMAATDASPLGIQTYTVTADDGFNQAQDTVVVVNASDFDLQGNCNLYTGAFGGTPATVQYDPTGTVACEQGNNDFGLHLCEGVVFEQVRLEGTLVVNTGTDDDFIGLVWGAQDASNFYSMSWKQAAQAFGGCTTPMGVVVKRVHAPSFDSLTSDDVYCPNDTANSTLLLTPAQSLAAGWQDNEEYSVAIDYTPTQSDITITRISDGVVLASFTVVDANFPNGFFGSTTYSQQGACVGPLLATCL